MKAEATAKAEEAVKKYREGQDTKKDKPVPEEKKEHLEKLDKMREVFDKELAKIEKDKPTKEEEKPKTEDKKETPKEEPKSEDKPKDKTSKEKSFNVSGDIKKIGQSLKGLSEEEEKRK